MPILNKIRKPKNFLSSTVFLLVLVGYPIFAGVTVYFGIDDNSLSVLYRFIVLTAASGLLFSRCFSQRLKVNYQLLFGSIFFAFYTIRMFLEWLLNSQGSKLDWGGFWVFWLFVCLMPALPFVWKKNLPNEHFTPNAIVVLGVIGLILNFYAISHTGGFLLEDQLFSGRMESERLNPISYGHLGVSTALISLWVIIRQRISLLAILGFMVGILGLVASGSRGPVLSFVVCFVLMLMKLNLRFVGFVVLPAVVFFAAVAILLFPIGAADVYIFNRVGESMFLDESRNEISAESFNAFLDNMLFGAGYPFSAYPHNIVLEAFMASGFLGGVLMIFTLLGGVIVSLKNLNQDKYSWMSILFVQYLVFSMVSNSIYYSNILWVLWFCVVAVGGDNFFSSDRNNAEVRVK